MPDKAVLFALLSLALGGLNEVVLTRYSARERARGMMIGCIGPVGATLLVALTLNMEQLNATKLVAMGFAVCAICLPSQA